MSAGNLASLTNSGSSIEMGLIQKFKNLNFTYKENRCNLEEKKIRLLISEISYQKTLYSLEKKRARLLSFYCANV